MIFDNFFSDAPTLSSFTANVLRNVKITPERVKVLVGDTLTLNCTAETTYNGRIDFTWDFPRRKVSKGLAVDTMKLQGLLKIFLFFFYPGKQT